MTIATAAYPLDILENWEAYEAKQAAWVADATAQGAELLVFPEYGAMELATLAEIPIADDLEAATATVASWIDAANAVHQRLARQHGVYILSGSAPVYAENGVRGRPVNRAHFFGPEGGMEFQDKLIMTRYEREHWDVVPGAPLQVFETALGRIGVLICYDSEFPLLGKALESCDVVLVPSCTETLAGYWRVRIGAMARALELQCVTVQSSVVGAAEWCDAVAMNRGTGGVFGPPDLGFPETGVCAEGQMNEPGRTIADVNLETIAHVREEGAVCNRRDWVRQEGAQTKLTFAQLR
ncbi:carbon-nitrogen hydrolase family protein [Shimia sp. NS0008-38b]|uniref:carbon-nitrogen hydrolase family protein n=1 Tax=Shimia sp. NS0008-38b TaxID=3127653 RepID=UPI00333EFB2D